MKFGMLNLVLSSSLPLVYISLKEEIFLKKIYPERIIYNLKVVTFFHDWWEQFVRAGEMHFADALYIGNDSSLPSKGLIVTEDKPGGRKSCRQMILHNIQK